MNRARQDPGLGRAQLQEVASLGGGIGKYLVVDGEKRELQAVRNAGLVVNAAQVVFDDLLLGAELEGDVLIFAALDNESDDLHFLGGEPIADAGTDGILSLHGGEVGALHKALSTGDLADALDEVCAADTSADDALESTRDVGIYLFGVFGDQDGAAAGQVELGDEGGHFQAEARSEKNDGAAEGVHGVEELFGIVTLGDDADVVFESKDTGRSRAENCLIVSQNKSVHRVFNLLL